jgi:hypothetical protein
MAGTKKTKGTLITWTNTNVNTNGIQAITGAILNQLFLDLYESIFFGTKAEARNVAISDAGTDITFATAFPAGATYKLLIRAYDTAGDEVACTIDPALQTVAGFHIVPATDGILDYVAISLDV